MSVVLSIHILSLYIVICLKSSLVPCMARTTVFTNLMISGFYFHCTKLPLFLWGDKCVSCLFGIIILILKVLISLKMSGKKKDTISWGAFETSPKSRPTEQMCPCGTIKTLNWTPQSAAVMYGDQSGSIQMGRLSFGLLFDWFSNCLFRSINFTLN